MQILLPKIDNNGFSKLNKLFSFEAYTVWHELKDAWRGSSNVCLASYYTIDILKLALGMHDAIGDK